MLSSKKSVYAIYPDDHFNFVTKIDSADMLSATVQENIEAGRTLFVRWIASPQ